MTLTYQNLVIIMSYILDALKKSEQQHRQHQSPPTSPNSDSLVTAPVISVINAIILFLLLIGLVIGLWVYRNPKQLDTTKSQSIDINPQSLQQTLMEIDSVTADLQAVKQTMANPTQPQPLLIHPIPKPKLKPKLESQVPSIIKPEIKPSEKNLIKSKIKSVITPEISPPMVPLLSEKNMSFQQQIPALNLNIHFYHQQTSQRFVMINLKKYKEQQKIDQLTIQQITPDGVIFSYQNQKFKILR